MIRILALSLLRIFDFFHQKKIFKFLKKQGYQKLDILFDVGAHRGESIKIFSKNFQIKKIYSFEASEINFIFLKKNISNYKKKNADIKFILENLAIGNEEKIVKIKHLSESSSSTINELNISSDYFKKKSFLLFKEKNNKFYVEKEVSQIKLSNYILKNKIPKIDFLKIDTEGYEMNVLLGLENQISKISIVMFEHHYDNMIIKNYKFRDINYILSKNNFSQIYKYKMPFRKTFEYIYARNKDL